LERRSSPTPDWGRIAIERDARAQILCKRQTPSRGTSLKVPYPPILGMGQAIRDRDWIDQTGLSGHDGESGPSHSATDAGALNLRWEWVSEPLVRELIERGMGHWVELCHFTASGQGRRKRGAYVFGRDA